MIKIKDLLIKYKSEYVSWQAMKARCSPSSNWHGGKHYRDKGIKVCERRLERRTGFINFLSDIGAKPTTVHSIERIDSNKDYTPENCCWATRTEQAHNTSQNVNLTFGGKTQCLTEWSKELNIKYPTLLQRLKSGWSVKDTLTVIPELRGSGRKKYR